MDDCEFTNLVRKINREVLEPALQKAVEEKQFSHTEMAYAELEVALYILFGAAQGDKDTAKKAFQDEVKNMLSSHCKV